MRFVLRWRRFRPRPHWLPPSFVSIVVGVWSSSGAATQASVGGTITEATFVSAGVGTNANVGAGVITAALSASGTATDSIVGKSIFSGALSAAGTSTATFGTELRQIVSTRMIQLPVNCVLAGDQELVRPGSAAGRALRRIFRE